MHRLLEHRNRYNFDSYSSVDAAICEIRRGNGVNVVRVYHATRTSVFKRLILRETRGCLNKRARKLGLVTAFVQKRKEEKRG